MRFNADVVLHKGHKHKICQDFVLSASFNSFDAVVLCDGCSSGPDTALGAQILCHSIIEQIRLLQNAVVSRIACEPLEIMHYVLEKAVVQAVESLLCIHKDMKTLLCTALVLIRTEDNFYMYRCGDGAFVVETTASFAVRSFHYVDNNAQETPFYPVYIMSDVIPDHFRCNVNFSVNEQCFDKQKNGSLLCAEQNVAPANDSFDMIHSCSVIPVSDDIVGVYIASDGIMSFVNSSTNSTADFSNVLSLLFGAKDSTGCFLERAVMSRFGAINTLSKDKVYNYDDLSIGGFRVVKEI